MEDFNLATVAQKSVKGMFVLTSRTFLVQVLGVIASFILTLVLSPSDFGVFFIVSSIVVFLNYFQDIGLAASLIQKKEPPTQLELRTTFTIQQLLVLTIVVPSLFFSQPIAAFFKLDIAGLYLLNAFLFSFFLSSLRTIPTVILERNLEFHKLVVPQVIENLVYNVSLITTALMGLGVTSFTIAVLLRSIVGLVVTYIVQPWKIGVAFELSTFRKLVSFGLPFQANSILALLKDDLLTLYIGKTLPLAQVGYIGFAQKWAFLPLRLVMDNVIKITFPSFSRLQHDPNALKELIEKSLFLIALVIFPVVVYFLTLSTFFIEFIPRYQKWEPAILALSFFALNALFASVTVPLTNFLNAIGKIKTTLYFMIFWTAATWILTPMLIHMYGFNGVPFASFLVAASGLLAVIAVKQYIAFSFFVSIRKQLVSAVLMTLFIYLSKGIVTSFPLLFAEAMLAGIFYIGVLLLIGKRDLLYTVTYIFNTIKTK